MAFIQASAIDVKTSLMIAISGPSGSGKTIAAMLMAKGLGGKTAIVNTEKHGPLTYINRQDLGLIGFDFLYQKLEAPYTPESYIKMIEDAGKAGCENVIFDSFSHEWNGTGGVLEMVDQLAKSKFKGNSWSAWSEMTPRHKKLLDRMNESGMTFICTMRSKTETSQQTDSNGKKVVVKLGMKAEQRDGIEYDFTVVMEMNHDGHTAFMTNDRTGVLIGEIPHKITEETGLKLRAWRERFSQTQEGKLEEPKFTASKDDESSKEAAPSWKDIPPLCDHIKAITDRKEFINLVVYELPERRLPEAHKKVVWEICVNQGARIGLTYVKGQNAWLSKEEVEGMGEGIVEVPLTQAPSAERKERTH